MIGRQDGRAGVQQRRRADQKAGLFGQTSRVLVLDGRIVPGRIQQGTAVVKRIEDKDAVEQAGRVAQGALVLEQDNGAPATGDPAQRSDLVVGGHALADWRPSRVVADILQHADILGAICRQLEDGVLGLRR